MMIFLCELIDGAVHGPVSEQLDNCLYQVHIPEELRLGFGNLTCQRLQEIQVFVEEILRKTSYFRKLRENPKN